MRNTGMIGRKVRISVIYSRYKKEGVIIDKFFHCEKSYYMLMGKNSLTETIDIKKISSIEFIEGEEEDMFKKKLIDAMTKDTPSRGYNLDKKLIDAIALEIQGEFGMGGLSGGLYQEYAEAITKRYIERKFKI